jgi:hypothetical protein
MGKNSEHTIESGLQALEAKAHFHRKEAERFDRLVSALNEASLALQDNHAEKIKPIGRPKNDEEKNALLEVIKKMPHEFRLTELKAAAKDIDLEVFRRVFREFKKSGEIETITEATGRRDGIYRKTENAA